MEIKMNEKVKTVEINGNVYNFVNKKNVTTISDAKNITLRLAIDDNEIEDIIFDNYVYCLDYLNTIQQIKGMIFLAVWDRGHPCEEEIFINSNPHRLINFLEQDYLREENLPTVLNFHNYNSFEDAYKVALDMREPHQLCYDRQTETQSVR